MGVAQETTEIIDPNDTMNPMDVVKTFNETAHDQLIASKDTRHEAQTDSEITHAIFSIAQGHQVVFALEIDVQVEVMNIHVLTHPCATRHVSYVILHNINLQIGNVSHHRDKSRQT